MRTTLRVAVVCVGLGAAVWACSDDATQAPVETPSAGDAGASLIGPEGGTVTGDGITIEIPPGALAAPTAITAAPTGAPPGGYTALSRLYTFGPDGTAFLKPVTVTFAIDPGATSPVVYWSNAAGGYDAVGGTAGAGSVRAEVTHFSTGFVAAGASPATDGGDEGGADAGDGGDAGATPVVVRSLDANGAPANMTWAAWQDGSGAWTPLAPTSTGHYEMSPTASTYAVAFMCADGTNARTNGVVYYEPSTVRSFDVSAGSDCAPTAAPTFYSLGGAMTNLPGAATYAVSGSSKGGGYNALNVVAGASDYSLLGFIGGKTYDVAIGVSDGSGAPTPSILKMLLVRNQTFAANVTRDIDWSAEGFVPGGPYTATLNGVPNGAVVNLNVWYATGGATYGIPMNHGAPTTGATMTLGFSSVTAGALATDAYVLHAYDGQGTAELRRFFHDAADVTTSWPAAFGATFATVATTPYIRPRYTFPDVASTTAYSFTWGYQGGKGVQHGFAMHVDPAFVSGAAPHTIDFPDFSGVAGWNAAWGAPASLGAGGLGVGASYDAKTTFAGGYELTRATTSGALP